MKLSLSPREKILLTVLIVTLASFFSFRYLLLPSFNHFQNLKQTLTTTQAKLRENRTTALALKQERTRFEEAQARYQKVRASFSSNLQDGGLVVNLGLEAIRCGVTITAFKPQATEVKEEYLVLPVEMELKGSYGSVLAFTESLEKRVALPNLTTIRKLKLTSAEEREGTASASTENILSDRIKAELTVLFYSEASPTGKLALEEIARWRVGRKIPFTPAEMVSPYPGVSPHGKPEAPSVPPAEAPSGAPR